MVVLEAWKIHFDFTFFFSINTFYLQFIKNMLQIRDVFHVDFLKKVTSNKIKETIT